MDLKNILEQVLIAWFIVWITINTFFSFYYESDAILIDMLKFTIHFLKLVFFVAIIYVLYDYIYIKN